MTQPGSSDEEQRTTIRSLFRNLSTDFEAHHSGLHTISRIFFEELARDFEPVLNAELQKRPCSELDEKRKLAAWVNMVLRELRLGIVCPKTGKAATLQADWKDAEHDLSRFRLEVRDERGKSVKTFVSHDSPTLKLREDRPRQQGSARFRESR